MEIRAAQRLKASNHSLKSVIGLDGELLKLQRNSGLYRVANTPDKALNYLTKRFGTPDKGTRGSALLHVWRVKDLDIVLSDDPREGLTLEIST